MKPATEILPGPPDLHIVVNFPVFLKSKETVGGNDYYLLSGPEEGVRVDRNNGTCPIDGYVIRRALKRLSEGELEEIDVCQYFKSRSEASAHVHAIEMSALKKHNVLR